MDAFILILMLVVAVLLGAVIALLFKLLQRPLPLSREELPATLSPEALEGAERRLAEQLTQRMASLELKEDAIARAQRDELSSALKSRFEENAKQLDTHLREVRESLKAMGSVHEGVQRLGEGVQRFNTLLSNVKTRGVWGELQLERLLSDIFASTQYEKNVKPSPRSPKIVEFALVLPGPEEGKTIWLPIDSKFPLDAYEGVALARTPEALAEARKIFFDRLKVFATQVAQYIMLPYTTDFAILYVPSESIFLEAISDLSIQEDLRRKHIVLAGPQTAAALFNALQMGFKTLAVQKQSAKAWDLLAKAKKNIDDYLADCDAVMKKLEEASTKANSARHRIEMLSRNLRTVTIPEEETPNA